MNFDELRKKRMEVGAKEHDGTGEGDWANWKKEQFVKAAQEELADCANYLDKMPACKAKILIPGLQQFYAALEKEKEIMFKDSGEIKPQLHKKAMTLGEDETK